MSTLRGVRTIIDVHVARALNLASDADVVDWACAHLAADSSLDDPLLVELAGLTWSEAGEVRRLLERFAERERPGFTLPSEEGEAIARRLFAGHCRRYLAGEIAPRAFCEAVAWLEVTFDFSRWIGDLYSVCDGAAQDAPPYARTPYLRAEVEAVLGTLQADGVR